MQTLIELPGSLSSRSRKYTIDSQFGHKRTPRSRKSRPCDACRKRKTACIIETSPPCLSCQRRGVACKASSPSTSISRPALHSPRHGLPGGSLDHPFRTESLDVPATVGTAESHNSPESQRSEGQHIPRSPQTITGLHAAQRWPSSPVNDFRYNFHLQAASGLTPPAADEVGRSLEGVPERTAHFLGPSAEQDTFLLHGFRPFISSEDNEIDADILQVYRGGPYPDCPPVHFMILEDAFPEHNNAAKRIASESIETIVAPFRHKLIFLYFKYIHPVYPVIPKSSFLRQYVAGKESLPASLRGAVYALASVFWHQDTSLAQPCPFEQHELVNHAHAALRRELEAPNMYKLQACLLLLHIRPPDVDSVETPNTWIQAAQATACAQMIGLHQDPTHWNIPAREKKLRKRLWWVVYMTDCWSAVCHGNPPHISSSSFSTPLPDMDDVRVDEDLTQDLHHLVDSVDERFQVADGVRFLEAVKIAVHLREILDCSFQTTSPLDRPESQRRRLLKIRDTFEYWPTVVPQCLQVGLSPQQSGADPNVPLHLSFYAAQVYMFRAVMHPATRAARATPDSNLRQWFPTALAHSQLFTDFVESVSAEDLQGFWVRQARSQFIVCGNFYIYLFLLASAPHDIEAAYRLLERFHQALQRLHAQLQRTLRHAAGSGPAKDGMLLIRPARLRIQSFFSHAAELIKSAEVIDG